MNAWVIFTVWIVQTQMQTMAHRKAASPATRISRGVLGPQGSKVKTQPNNYAGYTMKEKTNDWCMAIKLACQFVGIATT